MKYAIFFFSLCLSVGVIAQNSVNLNINHLVGNTELEYNSEFAIPGGDLAEIDRLEYYISQIEFIHDGGQSTLASEVWLLVNAFDQETYELGEYDIEQLEAVKFHIGVEMPYNTQDLTLWPADHPLAPKNPSMHWGWAAGYRFLAIEGRTGTGGADFDFEIHALGNVNYHQQSVEVMATAENGELNIGIDADYTQAFSEVATAEGGITHGESGDSVDILNNFRDAVFTAGQFVGVEEAQSDIMAMQIAPNPTANGESAQLLLELPSAQNFELEITDLSGKLVYSELVSGSSTRFELPVTASGVYLINLKSESAAVLTEKWVVK